MSVVQGSIYLSLISFIREMMKRSLESPNVSRVEALTQKTGHVFDHLFVSVCYCSFDSDPYPFPLARKWARLFLLFCFFFLPLPASRGELKNYADDCPSLGSRSPLLVLLLFWVSFSRCCCCWVLLPDALPVGRCPPGSSSKGITLLLLLSFLIVIPLFSPDPRRSKRSEPTSNIYQTIWSKINTNT